ncbi:helix-turn-helix domain-containing protein [Fibrella sp. HMF5335]|uniref:Helix-turn-helix domain-containing protein n=1 Tax=Fibrella rubiginis TaxID=2817060 RepID=A0A939K729_9BACT|nr:helix-turn-helix domain-containing protein [Fibrella rubiginis]MBO0939503.1 helix-turn-helix domain-containing protein [Fibrella rubiginis]
MITDNTLLNRFNHRLDQQLDKATLSIDGLCHDLGVSRSTLARVVKEQTGLSLAIYIRQYRLQTAQTLLETTDLRVTEIADRVGFATSQDLSRYFANWQGSTPTEYRKQRLLATPAPTPEPVLSTPLTTPAPTVPVPVSHRWPKRWLALGVLVLGLAGAGSWWATRPSQATQPVAVAVLPFENLGPVSSQYYTEGVMEQIHGLLTYVDGLRVISRTSASRFTPNSQPLDQIARQLGVTYLLTGQVHQQTQRVKVSVELVLAADNRTVWSNSYEGQPHDLFGFMSQTAHQIAAELGQQLSQHTRQKITQAPTQHTEAYNQYLKGQYLLRDRTEPGLRESVRRFDKAIALDSTFAEAWASRGEAYYLYGIEGYGPTPVYWKKAEKDVLTAIRFNAESGMAYAILANLYHDQNKWEQSLTTYRIALKYQPSDALINYWYSLSLRSIGQTENALQYSTKAIDVDPLHPVILMGHIGNLVAAHRMTEARAALAEGQRLHSRFAALYWMRGVYYINLRQYGPALHAFEQGHQLNSATTAYPSMIAYCYGRLGQSARAQACLDSLPDTPDEYANRATTYAGLGDTDRCLAYLERGANGGQLPYYLKVSPLFAFLHGNPRFEAVLRRVGLL